MNDRSPDSAPSGAPLLEIEHLAVRFGPTAVVDDVSFNVVAGEKFALVGESGGGKSTAYAIARELLPGSTRTDLVDGRPLGSGEGVAVAVHPHAVVRRQCRASGTRHPPWSCARRSALAGPHDPLA